MVNRGIRRWGVPIDSLVRAQDAGSGNVPVEPASTSEELLRMWFEPQSEREANLVVHWDRTVVRIPISLAPLR